MRANIGMKGKLATRASRPRVHRAHGINLPGIGRIMVSRDGGSGGLFSREYFLTHLEAVKRGSRGEFIKAYDLGSGVVTNVGVMSMANDANWAAPSAESVATLAQAHWHASGTGATEAKATDIQMQTPAAPTATEAVEGTHVLASAANKQEYKSVATLNYTSELAITEWGLLTGKILSATTGSPFTACAATEATVTAEPYTESTATVRGEQQLIVKAGTTTVYALITSNTKKVLKFPAWYTVSEGKAGSTPGNTETFQLRPVLWDHKVFSAINVINGDSIEFKYSLTINSGG